jgi:hypothetical protein
LHKQPSDIAIEDLSAPFILGFLNHLERQRHNCSRTRNARFAAIRSFMNMRPSKSLPSQHRRSRCWQSP